jgi:hypothetical protein
MKKEKINEYLIYVLLVMFMLGGWILFRRIDLLTEKLSELDGRFINLRIEQYQNVLYNSEAGIYTSIIQDGKQIGIRWYPKDIYNQLKALEAQAKLNQQAQGQITFRSGQQNQSITTKPIVISTEQK